MQETLIIPPMDESNLESVLEQFLDLMSEPVPEEELYGLSEEEDLEAAITVMHQTVPEETSNGPTGGGGC
ncbi:MAG: hypothetical protein HQL56_00730 [Magnetococcales bacterium]|nr:hypothetical protein [Magnetococcales bacterium]